MVQPTPAPVASVSRQSRGIAAVIVIGSAVVGTGALLGAIVLWAHYGTAVFFEMIASGIAACF